MKPTQVNIEGKLYHNFITFTSVLEEILMIIKTPLYMIWLITSYLFSKYLRFYQIRTLFLVYLPFSGLIKKNSTNFVLAIEPYCQVCYKNDLYQYFNLKASWFFGPITQSKICRSYLPQNIDFLLFKLILFSLFSSTMNN